MLAGQLQYQRGFRVTSRTPETIGDSDLTDFCQLRRESTPCGLLLGLTHGRRYRTWNVQSQDNVVCSWSLWLRELIFKWCAVMPYACRFGCYSPWCLMMSHTSNECLSSACSDLNTTFIDSNTGQNHQLLHQLGIFRCGLYCFLCIVYE
jgi:hypothetical protein